MTLQRFQVHLDTLERKLPGPIVLTKVEVYLHNGVFRIYKQKLEPAMKLADRLLGLKGPLIREQMSWASGKSEYVFHANVIVEADEELIIEFEPPNPNAKHRFYYYERNLATHYELQES